MTGIVRETDTIAAIATPQGIGGIGIIRVSGPQAGRIRRKVFKPSSGPDLPFESHRMYYGWACDPANGSVLDEVLAVFMKGPRSYTREDVLEIHCHGGPAVLRSVLEATLRSGARLAEPGEFTKRAVLNGRMDLAQAEAVLDLTRAGSEAERHAALDQLRGGAGSGLESIRSALLDVLAQVEAAIDFPEEDEEFLDAAGLKSLLQNAVIRPIDALIATSRAFRMAREGTRIVLAGRPNVGKSSLFNAMLGLGRVLVSPIPGTTRDIIEESIEMEGFRFVLVDTAGINDATDDPIEQLGIGFSMKELERADLVLVVMDAGAGCDRNDLSIMEKLPGGKPALIVMNKMDLAGKGDTAEGALDSHFPWKTFLVSALTGKGLEGLRRGIIDTILAGKTGPEAVFPAYIPNLRHKQAMKGALEALCRAASGLSAGISMEFVAMDLREALGKIDTIPGTGSDEDLFDRIFSRFCLGK